MNKFTLKVSHLSGVSKNGEGINVRQQFFYREQCSNSLGLCKQEMRGIFEGFVFLRNGRMRIVMLDCRRERGGSNGRTAAERRFFIKS